MNILPTGPHSDHDENYDRYFADLKRWNFDIAYNAFYAFPLKDVVGKYADSYRTFAARARAEGVPSCVQIQSVVANLIDIPISEAQYYADNEYYNYEHFEGEGKANFFGSFASTVWLEFLKKLTITFRQFGFQWVVYEEPMLHTDIPGTKDRMYELFGKKYPDLKYPTHQAETPEYLTLQALKRDTLVHFYDELARHAKAVGFEKAGLMPWFFTPTFENSPAETWATSCDIGRVTHIPDMDFIIVRMQPDNIAAQAMIAANGESVPTLSYYECLSHNIGKPIIMVNNPTDEHRPEMNRESALISYPFFQRYTYAAAAASPFGMSRHWYGKNYDEDSRHMELMTQTNDILRRLGTAACEIAFVFSYSGAAHVWPRPWREVWRSYRAFATAMAEDAALPFTTLFAETLQESLERLPHVRIIVLNEMFPIPPAEIHFLRRWLDEDAGRRLVYFGGRDGYRWGTESLYQHFRLHPPEFLELFGVDVKQSVELVSPDPIAKARFTGADRTADILGEQFEFSTSVCCRPKFSAPDAVDVIYTTEEGDVPLITRRRTPAGSEAWFVGISLEARRLGFPFRRFFDELLQVAPDSPPGLPVRVRSITQNMFFNTSQTGFFVVANCANAPGTVTLESRADLWDVSRAEKVRVERIELEPLSIRLFRVLRENTKLYDIHPAIVIYDIRETADGVQISGMFHRDIEITAAAPPSGIFFGSKKLDVEQVQQEGCVRVILKELPLTETVLTIAW